MKIGTIGLIERRITFRDILFKQKFTTLESLLSEKEAFLKRTKPQVYPDCVLETQEFVDSLDFIKKGFYWKEGEYEIHLYAYEISLKTPHFEKYKLSLTKRDVDILEKNIKTAKDFLADIVALKGSKIKILPQYFWNWAYPSIYRQQVKRKKRAE